MPLAEVGDPLQGFGEESGEDATLDTLLISWELVVVMILSILVKLQIMSEAIDQNYINVF